MSSIRYQTDDEGVVHLVLDAPGASVNTMHAGFRSDLAAAIERLEAERQRIRGVIVLSAKRSFFTDTDLRSLMDVGTAQAPAFFAELQSLKSSLRRLERLGRPVVALIEGSALGPGMEIALACHARLCLDDGSIELGFPEVRLGLMPGAGGVVRSVRMLGLQRAVALLSDGAPVSPEIARSMGLLDQVVPGRAELLSAARAWLAAHPDACQPWDDAGYRMPGGTPAAAPVAAMLAVAPAMLVHRTGGLYPAPEAILATAVEGAQVDFDTALRVESRNFTKLVAGQVAKNMMGTLGLELRDARDDDGTWEFVARLGRKPVVVDENGTYASRVVGAFVNEAMALLGEGVAPALIENTALQAGLAAGPLAMLDEISLKRLDDALHGAPAGATGAHAHDHAHDHIHDHTHDHTHGCDHGHGHGHAHRPAHDRHPPQASDPKHESPVLPAVIGMPQSAVYVLEKMAHGFRRMGRASGGGFYEYPEGEAKRLWPGLKAFARGRKSIAPEDVRDRLLYAQSVESLRCLQEREVACVRDANVGSIFGWGFPAWTGGTVQFVNHVGVRAFAERARALAAQYGERFEPPELLSRHAESGEPIRSSATSRSEP